MPQSRTQPETAPKGKKARQRKSGTAAPQPASVTPGRTLEWSYNPWRDSAPRGWRRPQLAMLLLLMCSAIAGYSLTFPNAPAAVEGQSAAQPSFWPAMLAWSAIAFTLACGMCATLFLPVAYKLDARGVTVTFLFAPSFRPWEHYRNFYVHDTGVHLTTLPKPSALDPFRGHFLQFGQGAGREEVQDYIAAHVSRNEAGPLHST